MREHRALLDEPPTRRVCRRAQVAMWIISTTAVNPVTVEVVHGVGTRGREGRESPVSGEASSSIPLDVSAEIVDVLVGALRLENTTDRVQLVNEKSRAWLEMTISIRDGYMACCRST